MKMNLNVTNKNIEDAKIADPSNCPIAHALKRTVRNLKKVYVYGKDAHLVVRRGKRNYRYTASLNKIASGFVNRFDSGLAVAPFKFNLNFKKAAAIA